MEQRTMKIIFTGGTEEQLAEITGGTMSGWVNRFGDKAKAVSFKKEPGRVIFECQDEELCKDMRKHYEGRKSRLIRKTVQLRYGIKIELI